VDGLTPWVLALFAKRRSIRRRADKHYRSDWETVIGATADPAVSRLYNGGLYRLHVRTSCAMVALEAGIGAVSVAAVLRGGVGPIGRGAAGPAVRARCAREFRRILRQTNAVDQSFVVVTRSWDRRAAVCARVRAAGDVPRTRRVTSEIQTSSRC